MSDMATLAERKAHLSGKLRAIRRMLGHLGFSRRRLAYPLTGIDTLDESSLESVSALIERFGKLQDLLGNVFREMLLLSGEDTTDMNNVLSRLEKIGVLASADDWRTLRALRNLGAHDYDDNDAGKTEFVNAIAARSAVLVDIAERATVYCHDKLNVEPC